jgi:hypothetical protein
MFWVPILVQVGDPSALLRFAFFFAGAFRFAALFAGAFFAGAFRFAALFAGAFFAGAFFAGALFECISSPPHPILTTKVRDAP